MDENPYEAPRENALPPEVIEAYRDNRRAWLRDRIALVVAGTILSLLIQAIGLFCVWISGNWH
jgi:hypothetical protein